MILLTWVALLGVTALLAQGWLDKRNNPNDHPVTRNGEHGNMEVVLERNAYGHYVASGRINGHAVVFMLDTGATDVVLPENVAETLDLKRGFPTEVETANGTVTAYTTTLKRVTLGPIQLNDVHASINPHMDGDDVLLGMSFLKHLHLTQAGTQLTLSQP